MKDHVVEKVLEPRDKAKANKKSKKPAESSYAEMKDYCKNEPKKGDGVAWNKTWTGKPENAPPLQNAGLHSSFVLNPHQDEIPSLCPCYTKAYGRKEIQPGWWDGVLSLLRLSLPWMAGDKVSN